MEKKLRVFIGLCEVAGYNSSLKTGFDALGIDAQFFNLSDHQFSYDDNSENNFYTRLIKYIYGKATDSFNDFFIISCIWMFCYYICTGLLCLWAIQRFDTFIFSFGNSFLRNYDLPILKLFNKQVIFVYLGTDSRPPYLNRKSYDNSLTFIIKQSLKIKTNVMKVEKYADYIINHPPTSHFHERKIVQFMKIGLPTWLTTTVLNDTNIAHSDSIRILHAPSHSEGKGTVRVRNAISNLQNKGYRIEYVEIINRPNVEVLCELSRCDFVVDELYSDSVMARFAAEAAFFSKPAIVGGYATEFDFGSLTAEEVPPVHHCLPDDIETAIEKLILDESYRITLGKHAKDFLAGYWSPRDVASRFLRLIMNDVPADWYYDPSEIRYLHGWGLTESQARTFILQFIEVGGVGALQLNDKPRLIERLQAFATNRDLRDSSVFQA